MLVTTTNFMPVIMLLSKYTHAANNDIAISMCSSTRIRCTVLEKATNFDLFRMP